MREMMFDIVHRSAKVISWKGLDEKLGNLPPLAAIPEPPEHELQLRRMRCQIGDFAQALGAIVLVDRDMIHIREARSCFVQAIGDGLGGKPSPMLDPAKPLLFGGCYQFPVTH